MKISEIIAFLEEVKAEMGDISIKCDFRKKDEQLCFDESIETIFGL